MTEQDLELQSLRRELERRIAEVGVLRSELSTAQTALCWTRKKLQEVQEENRRLKRMLQAQEENGERT